MDRASAAARAEKGRAPAYAVVVPTAGRPELERTLRPLLAAGPCAPAEIVVVDDRPAPQGPPPGADAAGVTVLRSGGRGPACARDVGWRRTSAPWVVFLDDDVAPGDDWTAELAADLAACGDGVGGCQGRIEVPPPRGRRPTDAERGTLALARARWITADMAYRRAALAAADGFDRRLKRAYREDTDLALRVLDAGYALVAGTRRSVHPMVRDARLLRSVAAQAGNADDALMRRLHGPRWRARVGEPPGRLRRHVAATAALAGAAAAPLLAPLLGPRTSAAAAAGLGSLWLAATAEFAWRRIAPGPRTRDEIVRMAVTSALIPPAACAQRVAGEWRHRRARPHRERRVKAVLFDRDGTLVHDVPYNRDPGLVRPLPHARAALERARTAGLRVGVVTNQSGVARGLITPAELEAVNAALEERLGPFDAWRVCVHGEDDGCTCRKPRTGLIEAAAADLGLSPRECAVIGDIGADVEAARAAGARSVLVPGPATRAAEVAAAPETAPRLTGAVRRLLRDGAA
ncbi:HAD-IIIA family hydrolase [Streptomonospora arabica]|uniref:D,D-heptose 1,7-bisphosphate phosphatase n=1 Tax=Streptomonospora arabica TaxID=412417 RepID=A0ABV9SPU2_9ACTN